MWSLYYLLILAAGKLESIDSIGGFYNNAINVRQHDWYEAQYLWKAMALKYKKRKCRPAVWNETILATRQEFFFTEVAPVQSITDIALLDFWLMLPYWTFISSYTTIYFFVKKFIFSNVYISVNTIFECLCMFFWLRQGRSIKYVRNWWRDEFIQNACSCVQGDRVQHLMYTYQLLSYFIFQGIAFVL